MPQRLHASGYLSRAKVQAGPNAFQIATWPDGTFKETEVSNLMPSAQSDLRVVPTKNMKRPAANVQKTSAAKKMKWPAAEDGFGHDDDDDDADVAADADDHDEAPAALD